MRLVDHHTENGFRSVREGEGEGEGEGDGARGRRGEERRGEGGSMIVGKGWVECLNLSSHQQQWILKQAPTELCLLFVASGKKLTEKLY